MKCPHCSQDIKYRERSNKHCARCKRPFLFEPRFHPLKLHELRFRRTCEKLGDNGRVPYTAGQLHHALVPKAGAAYGSTRSCLLIIGGLVAVVILVFALSNGRPLVALAVLAGALVLGALLKTSGSRRAVLEHIPLSPTAFLGDVIAPWVQAYGWPPGLLRPALLPSGMAHMPQGGAPRAVLVCHEPEILAWAAASGLADRLGIALLALAGAAPERHHLLAMIAAQPRLPLLVLHDASVEGCLLADEVTERLGLPAGRRVVDLGLRPGMAIKRKLLTLRATPDPPRMARLVARGKLSKAELDWLGGRWTPLLALRPAALLKLLEHAAGRVAHRPARASATPHERARAIGFMSWPEDSA